MENNWKIFYSTNRAYKVTIIKEVFAEQNIEVREVSKNQTGLPVGDIDLYVLEDHFVAAQEIIKKHPEL